MTSNAGHHRKNREQFTGVPAIMERRHRHLSQQIGGPQRQAQRPGVAGRNCPRREQMQGFPMCKYGFCQRGRLRLEQLAVRRWCGRSRHHCPQCRSKVLALVPRLYFFFMCAKSCPWNAIIRLSQGSRAAGYSQLLSPNMCALMGWNTAETDQNHQLQKTKTNCCAKKTPRLFLSESCGGEEYVRLGHARNCAPSVSSPSKMGLSRSQQRVHRGITHRQKNYHAVGSYKDVY